MESFRKIEETGLPGVGDAYSMINYAVGTYTGIKAYSLVHDGMWRGMDGKWYKTSWGGNQYTGTRGTVTKKALRLEKIGKYTFQIILTQGVNRQIRRMCEACGVKVRSLKRIRVMNIRLGDLKPGEWREVTGGELETLLTDTGMLNRK